MSRKLFIRRKAAAKGWIYSEDGKEVDGHESARRSLGVTIPGKDGLAAHEKSHIGKGTALRAPVDKIRIGDEAFRLSGALVVLPEKRKALRIRIGKRPKECGIRKTENCSVRASANGQSEY